MTQMHAPVSFCLHNLLLYILTHLQGDFNQTWLIFTSPLIVVQLRNSTQQPWNFLSFCMRSKLRIDFLIYFLPNGFISILVICVTLLYLLIITYFQNNAVSDLGLLYSNTFNFCETVSHSTSRSCYRADIILEMLHKFFNESYHFLYSSFLAVDKVTLESPQRCFTCRIVTHLIDYHIGCSMLNCHSSWARMINLFMTFMHKLMYKLLLKLFRTLHDHLQRVLFIEDLNPGGVS